MEILQEKRPDLTLKSELTDTLQYAGMDLVPFLLSADRAGAGLPSRHPEVVLGMGAR